MGTIEFFVTSTNFLNCLIGKVYTLVIKYRFSYDESNLYWNIVNYENMSMFVEHSGKYWSWLIQMPEKQWSADFYFNFVIVLI